MLNEFYNYNHNCISVTNFIVPPEFKEKIDIVDRELNVQLVPEIAYSMRDHVRVDGTVRFLAPNSLSGQIFKKIVSKNK